MDDKLREEIADYFARQNWTTLVKSKGTIGEVVYYKQADIVIALFRAHDWRKVETPPVLTITEIENRLPPELRLWTQGDRELAMAIAQAQVKWLLER